MFFPLFCICPHFTTNHANAKFFAYCKKLFFLFSQLPQLCMASFIPHSLSRSSQNRTYIAMPKFAFIMWTLKEREIGNIPTSQRQKGKPGKTQAKHAGRQHPIGEEPPECGRFRRRFGIGFHL
jgi:hypothetical protein